MAGAGDSLRGRTVIEIINVIGEMAERSKAAASKAVIPSNWNRGFESPSLLHLYLPSSVLRHIQDENKISYGW